LKGIKYFLEGNHLLGLLVDGLPNDPISSLTKLLQNLKLSKNVWL
jgi:hypothetical protein